MIGAITAGLLSGGTVAVPTPPVSGYYLWFDPSQTSSLTSSGGYVSQMNDLSGNNLHVSTALGTAYQPITGVDSKNGLNVLKWDQNQGSNGAQQGLSNNSGSFLSDPNLDFWVVKKHNLGPINSNSAFGIGNDQAGNGNIFYSFIDNGNSKLTDGVNGGKIFSTATQNGNWVISRFTKNGAAGEFFVNNTSQGTVSFNWNLPNSRIMVGAIGQGGATNSAVYSMQGDIGEIIVYKSQLNSTNATSTYNYLKAKWGF